jgi:hypothetical protein
MNSRHWWNGRWARLTRRDVFIRPIGGSWFVELRRGGDGGRARIRHFESEQVALGWVHAVLAVAGDGWREVDTRLEVHPERWAEPVEEIDFRHAPVVA